MIGLRGCAMRRFGVLALAISSVFLCPAVFAATLASVQGKVSVSDGNGYEPVSGPTQLNVGDTVMAGPEGSAWVIYDDMCSVPVKPGHVVVIAPEPPCHKTASYDPYGTLPGAVVSGGAGRGGGIVYRRTRHLRQRQARQQLS